MTKQSKSGQYATEIEANQELTANYSFYEKAHSKDCPIFRCACHDHDCVNWVEPYVTGNAQAWWITHGHCGSPLITGEIVITDTVSVET